ncbi:hypothetical protein TNIN_27671 [Trichonephila inaurata madagascariensis]|uniref:Uncharacterized protein n=1 Tax=Trichonephila inaurata madagascariensis TaxID=2747483 RepID=A0A8X6YHD4_9ARAC|nr:hypothetical protein TNIN_27671 [Trichonephila inaurata madagascariensis]
MRYLGKRQNVRNPEVAKDGRPKEVGQVTGRGPIVSGRKDVQGRPLLVRGDDAAEKDTHKKDGETMCLIECPFHGMADTAGNKNRC